MHGNVLHTQTVDFLAFGAAISAQVDNDLHAHLGQGFKTMFAWLCTAIEHRSNFGEVGESVVCP